MTGPFRRRGDRIEIRLAEHEIQFLSELPRLLETVGAVSGDPAADRLDVPAYLDDPEAEEEYRRWIRGELDEARAADRSAFVELVEAAQTGTSASEPEAEAFLRVLAEARLVLAARMGIEVEDDYEGLAEPDAAVLDYLGALQTLLIRELSA